MTNQPPTRTWILLEPDPEVVAGLVANAGVEPFSARLLATRGFSDPAEARAFLAPSLSELPDPQGMPDATRAAARLLDAVAADESVCVYGDYDVDGISAASLLDRFLGGLGKRPRVFLPDRFRDGYGLSLARLHEIADEGATLLITVDCGTTAIAEIAAMQARGVDVIVCDHHQPKATLPAAYALMNPVLPTSEYGDPAPCAVGVALVLAQATRRELVRRGLVTRDALPPLAELLEFAALGTIADMVPLRGVNRLLSWHGMRRLGRSERPGIRALAALDGERTARGADRVGFQLGPRINAAGRVADPMTAWRLLTTDDPVEAGELAERIDRENNRRREIQAEVVITAMAMAEEQAGRDHAIVVASPAWHAGVVGIVASRLKEQFGVPAFVLAVGEDGLATGSGRSIEGYSLVAGLTALQGRGLFERFGGHDFAAGLTLQAERIDEFRSLLVADVAERLPADARISDLVIDAEVALADLDFELLARIEAFEPFGKGNRRPNLLIRDLEIARLRRVGRDGDWVKASFAQAGDQPAWAKTSIDAFSSAARFDGLERGERVDIVATLHCNTWRGRETLELRVAEIAAPAHRVEKRPPGPRL